MKSKIPESFGVDPDPFVEAMKVPLDRTLTEEPSFTWKEAHDMQQKLVISYVLENEKLENENKSLIEAIKKFHKAKNRYHSQIACAEMFELVGLPAQYPDNYERK